MMEPISYNHQNVIAKGSLGSVDLYARTDGKLVVIKTISLENMSQEEEKAACKEAELMSRFNHPNVIYFYECFIRMGALCIVMEYAAGGTLQNFINKRGGLLLSQDEVVYMFSQVVLGLHHIHSQGVLHRDLKPSNILLHPVGAEIVVKIADFGISKLLESKTRNCSVLGTPCYLAPELCEGHTYNVSSDIWALGCVLCETMTLKITFATETLGATIKKILQGNFTQPNPEKYGCLLRDLLNQLLKVNPAERPTTAMIMANVAVMEMCHILCLNLGLIPYKTTKQQ